MPFALIIAFVASLGAHALALVVPEIDLSTAPEPPPPLTAELLPPPRPPSAARPPDVPVRPAAPRARAPRTSPAPHPEPAPAPVSPPDAAALPASVPAEAEPVWDTPPPPEIEAAPAEQRLPTRGSIRFRVERGDQGFEIGYSIHRWEIADGDYRIASLTETSGLVALFKSVRIEQESRGRLTAQGLQPEHFTIRRNGRETAEGAEFDWQRMQVRIGGGPPQAVVVGAQDLLSFHYQLGFLPRPQADNTLPIATGKKFDYYRLEALGEENVAVPAGTFRTLHLRAAGNTTTELWLAYDALLLPVKIRHIDRKGDSFVQVATELNFSQEE